MLRALGRRFLSSANTPKETFRFADLEVRSPSQKKRIPTESPTFGAHFTDHMLMLDYDKKTGGWQRPLLLPFGDFNIHPAAKVLHYSTTLFDALKAYRTVNGQVQLFRPELNIQRLLLGAERTCLPTFDPVEFSQLLCEFVRVDSDWVPDSKKIPFGSLYVRLNYFATEGELGLNSSGKAKLVGVACTVGAYRSNDRAGSTLLADPRHVRAWEGGVGRFKMGCNYAPTVLHVHVAAAHGCDQYLWLYGKDEKITESTVTNIFIVWKNEKGEIEVLTPPLDDGLILGGVTRLSTLELLREWGEFRVREEYVTMRQLFEASKEGRLLEMFGTGTALVVNPIKKIVYLGAEGEQTFDVPTFDSPVQIHKKVYDEITDIQEDASRLDEARLLNISSVLATSSSNAGRPEINHEACCGLIVRRLKKKLSRGSSCVEDGKDFRVEKLKRLLS